MFGVFFEVFWSVSALLKVLELLVVAFVTTSFACLLCCFLPYICPDLLALYSSSSSSFGFLFLFLINEIYAFLTEPKLYSDSLEFSEQSHDLYFFFDFWLFYYELFYVDFLLDDDVLESLFDFLIAFDFLPFFFIFELVQLFP